MKDSDYEQFKQAQLINQNPTQWLDMKRDNPIKKQTECFSKLTKIAGKPEISGEKFEPFQSKYI